MTSIASIKKCLVQHIHSEAPQGHLLVVYVFGSFARNQERVKSDIDLAFLVEPASYRMDAFEATAPVHMVAGKMGMKLDRIITTGHLLFESDVELRLQYEIKIKGMYFDFQPFLSELRVRKMAKLGPMMV
jgi:predicted nucleotidyltransferase